MDGTPLQTASTLPEFILKALDNMSAAQVRQCLTELYQTNKGVRDSFYEMTQRAAALNVEYHLKRLKEHLPTIPVEEEILITTLDVRQTPASLDKALTELAPGGAPVAPLTRMVFDRKEFKIYVYGKLKN